MLHCLTSLIASGLIVCLGTIVSAQDRRAPSGEGAPSAPAPQPQVPARDDGRAQYPTFLSNSFASLNVGYLGYRFSDLQLEPGHQVDSIHVPHVAVRAMLFGRHFGKYLSAQASYMRPVRYVKYRNVDGRGITGSVWMHFGTVTLQSHIPITGRVSVYGEGGLAITNRSGFEIDETRAVDDAHFTSPLLGAGFEYRVNGTWDAVAGATYIRPAAEHRQPHTLFVSTGFRYNLRPLPTKRVEETRKAGFIFPENLVQVGYTTNALGYSVNNFVSKTIPIFWGGNVEVRRSVFAIQYSRNVFHTRKVFALDLGASFAQWTSSRNGETFRTLSAYSLLRFTVLRSRPTDLYVSYSVAGPSYISRDVIDDLDTGSRFTFQDFMAVGVFIGERKHINAEVALNHYSNGNIQSENAGVKIPLTFKLGYAF